jgi:hypothetical protein
LEEVAEAAVLGEGESRIDDDMRLPDPGVLLDICQGLTEYDAKSNTVTLAHSSVRTFLTSSNIKKSKASWYGYTISGIHATTAKKCLNYLMCDPFKDGFCSNDVLANKLKDYPFLNYATQYWPLHARLSSNTIWFKFKLMDFCLSHRLPNGGNFTFWVKNLISNAPEYQIKGTQPLYYAASFGLTDLVRSLLSSKSVDIEATGGRYNSSALHVAVFRGHTDIVRILLDCGANVNALDEEGTTPLFWADKTGRKEIVGLLKDPRYAGNSARKVVQLSSRFEHSHYPTWFCCQCKKGPRRGKFLDCWECSHKRCEDCFKVAGDEDAPAVPADRLRWLCCSCGSGPKNIQIKACEDCKHGKCSGCWTIDVVKAGS